VTVAEFPKELENTIALGDTIETLSRLPDDVFDFIVTSPPYFNAREYAQWATYQDYVKWLGEVLGQLGRTLKPGRRLCWNICDYAIKEDNGTFAVPISADSVKAAERAGLKLKHWILWEDPAALARRHPIGSFPNGPSVVLHHTVEFVIVFQKPLQKYHSHGKLPPELEPYDKMGKDFFIRFVANQIWRIRRESNAVHPAVFPEELVEPMIRMWSRPGELVLDPFMGSGTTAVSAMLWRRKFFGIERDETYRQYALDRIKRRELAIMTDAMTNNLFELGSDRFTEQEIRAMQIVRG
jgi:DNA modification methylase